MSNPTIQEPPPVEQVGYGLQLIEIAVGTVTVSIPEHHCNTIAQAFKLATIEASEENGHRPYREDLMILYSVLAMFFEAAGLAAESFNAERTLSKRRFGDALQEARHMQRVAAAIDPTRANDGEGEGA